LQILHLTGHAMANRGATPSANPRPVKRTGPRPTPVKRGRRQALVLAFAAASLALASAFAVIFLALPKRDPAPSESTASVSDGYRTATIIRDTGDTTCAHATFDNATGRISHSSNPHCEATALDATAPAPEPLGTMHTLSAISNSFR
jgi:hypothetical protein